MVQINIENLANPEARRFRLGMPISSETVEYGDTNSARRSRLATKIFGFPWTQSVTVGTDFVDVIKQDWVEWEILAQPLAGLIKEHLEMKLDEGKHVEENPKIEVKVSEIPRTDGNGVENPTAQKIIEILDTQINPAVAMHGGQIQLVGFKDNKAYIQMEGGCQGCSSSKATLKQGVEASIKKALPDVLEVIDVTDHSTGENPYFR